MVNPPTFSAYDTTFNVKTCLANRKLYGMNFGLERMRALLDQLGNPQRDFRSIHVVGTNGKSSTTVAISEFLQQAGLQTGAYLSPHLRDIRERILLAGTMVDRSVFAQTLAEAEASAQVVDRKNTQSDQITQFELLSATAFLAFSVTGIDVAVVEAGLGGRYDATNVLPSVATVLTNIALEHTELLGKTHSAIAAEKLAVIQPQSALITTTELQSKAYAVAEKVTQEQQAQLVLASTEGLMSASEKNIALAKTSVNWFCQEFNLPQPNLQTDNILLSGRFEHIRNDPPTFFDGAHNPAAITQLASELQQRFPVEPLHFVVAVLADKDAEQIAKLLAPLAATVTVTASGSSRDLAPETMAQHFLCAGAATQTYRDPQQALEAASRNARKTNGAVIATGSLKLIAALYGS